MKKPDLDPNLLKLRMMDMIEKLGSMFIKWGGGVIMTYFLYLIIKELAGKNTWADIDVNFLGKKTILIFIIGSMLFLIFGIGGLLYGRHQSKLRKDTVEQLGGRVRDFETEADPKRSSSNLTKRGDTRLEDKK